MVVFEPLIFGASVSGHVAGAMVNVVQIQWLGSAAVHLGGVLRNDGTGPTNLRRRW
jgi:hypothetical protein